MTDNYAKLKSEIESHLPVMSKAADVILDQEVSEYPIFVLFKDEVSIGVRLIEGDKKLAKWSINASTLEELATKNVIDNDKVEQFRQVYKDPTEYFCLFVIDEGAANFVFSPRR